MKCINPPYPTQYGNELIVLSITGELVLVAEEVVAYSCHLLVQDVGKHIPSYDEIRPPRPLASHDKQ